MISRNWPNGFARVCAISLVAWGCDGLAGQPPGARTPAVVLLDGADAAQWQSWTRELGWRVIAPAGIPPANIDQRVIAIAAQVEAAIREGGIDPGRVYLAARGESAPVVWYAISRVPDLWAAGVVLGGSPKAAIDTNRLFAANFTNAPVLWVSGDEGKALAE